ncbi:hypothetical protein HPB47_026217 [Ixodes persulcatus]|uniref:Uncharacterized protein n=1 Tax=Ixodes persulcatus TaxID=34615 RepID=A0AC60Q167_IXOPE|nr:hypothetical protein HPB47_026217 [Ixodes persulcatus]
MRPGRAPATLSFPARLGVGGSSPAKSATTNPGTAYARNFRRRARGVAKFKARDAVAGWPLFAGGMLLRWLETRVDDCFC